MACGAKIPVCARASTWRKFVLEIALAKGGCDRAGAIVFSAFELIAGILVMLVGRYAGSRACSPCSFLSMCLLPTRSGPIQLPSGTVSLLHFLKNLSTLGVSCSSLGRFPAPGSSEPDGGVVT